MGYQRVRCVLLDLDGTLYDSKDYSRYFDSVMSIIIADSLSIEKEEATQLLKVRKKEKGTLTRAVESLGLNREEFHRLVAEKIHPELFLTSDIRTQEVITSLRTNFKLGLVSNSGRPLVEKIMGALGLNPGLFDVIVTGTDVEPKPSHQPFFMALDRIGCRKEETVYVGDRDEAEIRPAHEIGLRTILLARSKMDPNQAEKVRWADVIIHDLSELGPVLAAM